MTVMSETTLPQQHSKVPFAWICVLLGATVGVGLMLRWQLPLSHSSRVAAAIASVVLGIVFAGKTVGRPRPNPVFLVDPQGIARVPSKRRLSLLITWTIWFAAGAGGGLGSWWFMPTTEGINLWSARQESQLIVNELTGLPQGDVTCYLRGRLARKLVAEFPSCRQQVQKAERDWIERTVTRWKQKLETLPDGAFAEYIEFKREREKLPLNSKVAESLREVEDKWTKRTVTKLESDLSGLTGGDFGGFQALEHFTFACSV